MRDRRENIRRVVRNTAFNGGNNFSVVKVPRQCPLILLLKVG
jgi:hypothetical protein